MRAVKTVAVMLSLPADASMERLRRHLNDFAAEEGLSVKHGSGSLDHFFERLPADPYLLRVEQMADHFIANGMGAVAHSPSKGIAP